MLLLVLLLLSCNLSKSQRSLYLACTNTDGTSVLTEACQCSKKICATGDRCYNGQDGQCTPLTKCPHVDGVTRNTQDCLCSKRSGSGLGWSYAAKSCQRADYTDDFFCFTAYVASSCDIYPLCSNMDGTIKNTNKCKCGATGELSYHPICGSCEHCSVNSASQAVCSKDAETTVSNFYFIFHRKFFTMFLLVFNFSFSCF